MSQKMTPDEIWGEDGVTDRQRDLFDRRQEAEHLIAYIESVAGRKPLREDKRAYTIAIDARYGEGKSFFLRRLAEHLSINHPVAFVDAWADDLADEPLTALAATLKSALEPYLQNPEIKARVANFLGKSGEVAKIVGLGLARRAAGFVIGAAAVEGLGHLATASSEEMKEALEDSLRDAGSEATDEAVEAIRDAKAKAIMEKRVAEFKDGKAAIQSMKDSLSAIVDALDQVNDHPPIVIIIDELDRCRPTYAVKLLEEIKHLFDVPGIVFILALHSDQLGHSVAGAYGAGFDGRAYLRRFIDREYRLATPELSLLLEKLCKNTGITEKSFAYPPMVISQTRDISPSLPEIIAHYLKVYGLGARDAFELVDILQTSVALTQGQPIQLPYFLPLAIGMMKNLPEGVLPAIVEKTDWVYTPHWSQFNRDATEWSFKITAEKIHAVAEMPSDQYVAAMSQGNTQYPLTIVRSGGVTRDGDVPLWHISGYRRLLRTVARFSNPQIDIDAS